MEQDTYNFQIILFDERLRRGKVRRLLIFLFTIILFTWTSPAENAASLEELADDCSLGNKKACQALADIIKNTKDKWYRKDAAELLMDQTLLSDIAKNSEDSAIRLIATEKINDQSVLAIIAKNDENIEVRVAAVKKLTDKVLLSNLAQRCWYNSICEAAIQNPNLDDQSLFERLAKIKGGPRRAAIERLTDSKLLAEIATFESDSWVRSAAIQNPNLKDHALLAKIASGYYEDTLCEAALKNPNLIDQTVLADIAKNYSKKWLREAAIINPNLTDQKILTDIAKNHDEDWIVREEAVRKLNDQNLLADIAKNEPQEWLRVAAINNPNLTDLALLSDIAKNSKHSHIRVIAAKKYNDQLVLADITKKDINPYSQLVATSSIDDQKNLARIIMKDKNEDVRIAAIKKLTDQALLTEIFKKSKESWIRAAVVDKMTDLVLLSDISKRDKDEIVRRAAVERLSNQTLLAKAVFDDSLLCEYALKILLEQYSQSKLDATNQDWRIRLIFRFIAAFDPVPTEHKLYLMLKVLPVIRVLLYPEIASEIGEIDLIDTSWSGTSQNYGGALSGFMHGEIFTFKIIVHNLQKPLSYQWSTNFPLNTSSFGFLHARVYYQDFLEVIFRKLKNQQILLGIIKNNKDYLIRYAAVKKLVDQAELKVIAKKDKDPSVRKAAENRLKELQGK